MSMAVYIFNQNMTEINFCFVFCTLVYLSCALSRSFSAIWICFILSVAMWCTEEIRYDEFKRKMPTAKIVCSQWNRVLNQRSINRYFQILTVLYLILMSSKSTQKSEHLAFSRTNFDTTTNVSLSDQYVYRRNMLQSNIVEHCY